MSQKFICLQNADQIEYLVIGSMLRDSMRNQTQYIIDEKGRKIAVVLPIEEYEELLADLHDLAIIAERRGEATLTLEEIKERLRKDGIL